MRLGRADEARAALEILDAWTRPAESASAGARLAAGRAMVADRQDAGVHFEEALRLADEARPFERARIHLLYGEHLRRARRRSDARCRLRTALEVFEECRAEPWAERAAAELRACGDGARRRDLSAMGELTWQELQISRHVAQGLANKEVAARLYLSPLTIEYHLRNVFAKLGISSRTQLACLALRQESAQDGTPHSVPLPARRA